MRWWLALWIVLAAGLPRGVHAADAASIVLRVSTPTYTLDETGLRVPDYAVYDAAGAPALPVWATWVELPPTGKWSIAYESRDPHLLAAPAPLLPLPSPQATLDAPLAPEQIAERVTTAPLAPQPDPAIYGTDAFYPASPVQAGPEQWQRGRRLLAVRVFPFQYNPVTGKLLYHSDVEVRVTAEAVTTKEAPLGSDGFSRPSGAETAEAVTTKEMTATGALRIRTAQRGLHRLTYADLANAGAPVGSIDPRTFAMTYLDEPIAIEVTGEADGRFDSGDLVIFYAEPYVGRYMTTNVYRLSYGGAGGPRMAVRSVPPDGSAPLITAITQTLHIEYDRSYYSTYPLPQDADHWFDNPLYPNAAVPVATVSYALALDDPLFTGSARIVASLHGGVAQNANPDQSVALQVNGHSLGLFQWKGRVPYQATATFPAAWLDAPNPAVTLEAALSQLPGLAYYWILPDWVQLSYPARPDAEGDHIVVEGFAVAGQRMRMAITGFSQAAVRAYDVRNLRQPVRLGSVATAADGGAFTAHLWDAWPADAAPPGYALATDGGLLAPVAVEVDVPSTWRSSNHTADYIAIVHRSLWDAVQPLLDHRAAEGLRVAKVDVQDIYDEFSAGRVDPEAIRRFLGYAYRHWNAGQAPPAYVLLVGDGHYDFKNAAGTNLPNLIPPYLIHIDPWIGETAADNRYVSVDGPDDYLPDLHIGRIPAPSPADLAAVVQKILAYETASPSGDWQRRAVFVADDYANRDGNFHALSEPARLLVQGHGYDARAIYYRMDAAHDTGAEMRSAIQAAFNDGALYLQWFGHASPFRWGSVAMYDVLAPPQLQPNQRLPFTAHYGCWSGYFIGIQGSGQYGGSPQVLGEVLLLTPGRGAVADLSPSGLHIGLALQTLNQGVAQAIFRDRVGRVAAAVDAARAHYAAAGAWPDVVDTSILLGDPALKLRLPPLEQRNAVYLPLVTARR